MQQSGLASKDGENYKHLKRIELYNIMKDKKELKTKEVTKTETYVYDNCPKCDKEIKGKSESQVEYWMMIHNPGKGKNCLLRQKII